MLKLDVMARAASDNNKLAESDGFDGVMSDLGIDGKDAGYLAGQRALRAFLVMTGRRPDLMKGGKMDLVALSAQDSALVAVMASVFLDGLTTGVRASQDVSKQ